jgi:hypothetical protein
MIEFKFRATSFCDFLFLLRIFRAVLSSSAFADDESSGVQSDDFSEYSSYILHSFLVLNSLSQSQLDEEVNGALVINFRGARYYC